MGKRATDISPDCRCALRIACRPLGREDSRAQQSDRAAGIPDEVQPLYGKRLLDPTVSRPGQAKALERPVNSQRADSALQIIVQLVLLDLVVKRSARDTQFFGGGGTIALVALDRFKDHVLFHHSQRPH